MSYNPAISALQIASAQPILQGSVFDPPDPLIPALTIWVYDSLTDDASAYLSSGYFRGVAFKGVRTGDLVIVKDRTNNNTTTLNEVIGFVNINDATISPIGGGSSGGITAIIGDLTASGSGVVTGTLATVNTDIGSFSSANITVDGKGRIIAAANGSGGTHYTLPPATALVLGGIKVGANLTVQLDGTLNANSSGYTLPEATISTLGGVKVGSGLNVAVDGTISIGSGFISGSTINQIANVTLLNTNIGNTYENQGASGSVTLTLPAASLNVEFAAYIATGQIMKFLAVGTDKIASGGDQSVAAGNIQSSTIGNYLKIKCLAPGIWAATSIIGDWTLT